MHQIENKFKIICESKWNVNVNNVMTNLSNDL